MNEFKQIPFLLKAFVLKLIIFYQKTLSFDHGILKGFFPNGYCKYHPSCSEYTYQSIEKHGVMKGTAKGCWRILRCNPWSKGGYDPVEKSLGADKNFDRSSTRSDYEVEK